MRQHGPEPGRPLTANIPRLILIYLIAASLPLGIFPSEDLLEEFQLQEQFADLLPPLQVRDALNSHPTC